MRINHTNNDGTMLNSAVVNKEEQKTQQKTQKTISLADEDHVHVNAGLSTFKKQDDDLINETLRAVRFGMQKHSQTVDTNNAINKPHVSLVQKAFSSAEEFLTFATTDKKIRSSDKDVVQFLKQARSSLKDGHQDVSVLSTDLQDVLQFLIKEK